MILAIGYKRSPDDGSDIYGGSKPGRRSNKVLHDFDKWMRAADIGAVPGWASISDSKDLSVEQGNRRGPRLPPYLISFTKVAADIRNVDSLAARRGARL